jgi:sigma-B regulation protein RsbQ
MNSFTWSRNNVNVTGNLRSEQTIVFGPGFGTDQTAFNPLIEYFGKSAKLVLYDNVGNGKAELLAFNPPKYSSLKGYKNDLLEICAGLNIRDAVFVGHSISGMVGLMVDQEQNNFFSSLVLIGSSPRYLNDVTEQYIGGFNQGDLDQLYQAMRSNFTLWAQGFASIAMKNENRPELVKAFASTLSSMRPDIAVCLAKTIFEADCRNILNNINKPVLVMQTVNDIAVPASVGDYLHANIANSKLVHVNTEGHFPHMSAPDEVINFIKAFL